MTIFLKLLHKNSEANSTTSTSTSITYYFFILQTTCSLLLVTCYNLAHELFLKIKI